LAWLALVQPMRAVQEATRRPLTLAEAVHAALARGDRAASARDRIGQAMLSLRLARSAFAPKFTSNLFGSFGQTNVANQSYGLGFSQRFTTGTEIRANVGAVTSQNQLGNFYSTDTTLLFTQPLLKGAGREVSRRELTSAEAAASEAARQQALTEQQVALDVAEAYYRLVTQNQLLANAEKTLERVRKLRDASAAKLSVGKVSRLDLLRAEQLVSETDLQLLDARVGVEDAQDQLRLLINEESGAEISVAAEIPVVPESVTEEQAVQTAMVRRLDLLSADQAVVEARRAVTVAGNDVRPQFDLNLAFTRRETADSLASSFGLDKFKLATFATVSLPFDRTPQLVGLDSAGLVLGERLRTLTTLRERIAQDVRRAVRQHARLEKSLQLAESNLDFASEEVDLALLRFERGLSNNLDVVTAEGALVAARSRAASVRAELALARFRMRAAMGTLDPRVDVQ